MLGGVDGTEGVRVKSQSSSGQSESVCSLVAVLRTELLFPGGGESCRIPGKLWNCRKALAFPTSAE